MDLTEVKRLSKMLTEHEGIAINKLIWYLKAGNRRKWRIMEKVDENLRGRKEFILT